MNTKALIIAPVMALLLGVGSAGLAATSGSDGAAAAPDKSGMMRNNDAANMGHMMSGGMKDGGMMGGCPMMGAASGPNSNVTMQMHGEMMRAMGDIMMKYADKLEVPSSPK